MAIGAATGGFASDTAITLEFYGVNKTARSFTEIQGSLSVLNKLAGGFSAGIASFGRKLVGIGAFVALGRSIATTARSLSELSDRAADAGTTSPMLQKITGALREIGVKGASLDMVAKSMQNMARLTGETGAAGFAKVLGQASRLGSEQERLVFLSQAFGRQQGAAFAALVREGDGAIAKFVELAAEYPAVSDAAAMAGDRAADAMARATDAIKAAWGETVAQIIVWIEDTFGPLPEIAADAAQGIMVAIKAVVDSIRAAVLVVRMIVEPIVNTFISLGYAVSNLVRAATESGYSFRDAIRDSWDVTKAVFIGMGEGMAETIDSLFDFSNVGANLESAPTIQAMEKAIRDTTPIAFGKEAEKAAGKLADGMKQTKGGTWALKGSAAARRIISGDPHRGAAESADRAVVSGMPTVVDCLRRIADSTLDTSDALAELEAI